MKRTIDDYERAPRFKARGFVTGCFPAGMELAAIGLSIGESHLTASKKVTTIKVLCGSTDEELRIYFARPRDLTPVNSAGVQMLADAKAPEPRWRGKQLFSSQRCAGGTRDGRMCSEWRGLKRGATGDLRCWRHR